MKGRVGTLHLFQDVGVFGGPDERLGSFIVMVDMFADGFDEILDVAEDAAAQLVLGRGRIALSCSTTSNWWA